MTPTDPHVLNDTTTTAEFNRGSFRQTYCYNHNHEECVKELLEYDQTQMFYCAPKKQKLICIRIPEPMRDWLKQEAKVKGFRGYSSYMKHLINQYRVGVMKGVIVP